MPKMLIIDYKRCHGCGVCESFCASREAAPAGASAACIRSIAWDLEGWGAPVTCQHCEEPVCLAVCPQDAIYRDEELGRVLVDYERCIGCHLCLSACPFGSIGFDGAAKKVVKCDLCGGEPVCVDLCSYGALLYTEASELVPEVAEKIRLVVMGDRFRKESPQEPPELSRGSGIIPRE